MELTPLYMALLLLLLQHVICSTSSPADLRCLLQTQRDVANYSHKRESISSLICSETSPVIGGDLLLDSSVYIGSGLQSPPFAQLDSKNTA